MLFRKLDFLSPGVTFYYKGSLSHSSIFSGILSLILLVCLIIVGIYYSLDIIERKNPNSYYFQSYVEDAGIYYFNLTSLFHFINIMRMIGNSLYNETDFTYFNIIGHQSYINTYLNVDRVGIDKYDHWLYGKCNDKNNYELKDLITYNYFEQSACIKKYYNSTERKYYEIGDPKFSWPKIAHGTFNENNTIYGIYLQKCDNSLIKHILGNDYVCKNDTEIENYFNIPGTRVIYLYFVNTYMNVLDYYNPHKKFFFRVEAALVPDSYGVNYLNIKPTLVRSHYGLVLDKIRDDISYTYDRNDVSLVPREGHRLFMGYCFFLKNIIEYNERTYKRIQDIISSFGGVNQALTMAAVFINLLYNKFIVLSDTEKLLNCSIIVEKNIMKKIIKKEKEKEKEKEKKDKKEKKSEKEIKDITDKKRNNRHHMEIKHTETKKMLNETSKIIIEDNNSTMDNEFTRSTQNIIKNNEKNINTINNNLNNLKIDLNIKDTKTKNKHKGKINFLNYIFYKLNCKGKQKSFQIYEDFRIKLISEEHLIRNHLNVYNLLKITKKRKHISNSYHLKELMDLV